MDNNIPSENLMQHLFQTDNPSALFNEVLNKSVDKTKQNNRGGVGMVAAGNAPLPPVQLSNESVQGGHKIPRIHHQPGGTQNVNNDVLRGMLGESYFNNLVKTPPVAAGAGSGSILEAVANSMSPQPQYQQPQQRQYMAENYEIVEDTPKQLSLVIEGKSYSGKIVQNKKGQILFVINNTQAFVLTPSTLKTVSKK